MDSDTYGHCIKETGLLLDSAMKMNERIVLEGAQGCLLDIDQGTYPFVTTASQAEVMPVMELVSIRVISIEWLASPKPTSQELEMERCQLN